MTETPTTENIPVKLNLSGNTGTDGAIAAGLVNEFERLSGLVVTKTLSDGITELTMEVPPNKMELVTHFITRLNAYNIRVEKALG